jgi:geranylgeranyl reductase family protein
MRYDVIVVGGGPAGSTTARECAARGLSVLLIDKAEFPRDKPCGGGVNVHTARLLPFDVEPVCERVIYGMQLSVRQAHSFTRHASVPLSYLTQRRWLDAFLLDQARRAGVSIREKHPIGAVDRHSRGLTVRAGGEAFETLTLVAADGANGPTARLAGLEIPRWTGIAFEGNVTPAGGFPAEWEDTFGVDVGDVPGGYGWIFPKGDHLNIGVGGWHGTGPTLRQRVRALTRFYGFDPDSLWGLRGHPLPVRQAQAPLTGDRVLAVGDAAGLLDPLSGDGIYSAVFSAAIAARHLAAYLAGQVSSLQWYQEELERVLAPDLTVANQLRDLFQLAPTVWARFIRVSPRAWSLVCRLLRGDQTYAGIKTKSPGLGFAIDIVSDAVRATSILQRIQREAELLPPERYFRSASKSPHMPFAA